MFWQAFRETGFKNYANLVLGVIVGLCLTMYGLLVTLPRFYNTIRAIINNHDYLFFEKGGLYLIGALPFIVSLSSAGIYVCFTLKKINAKYSKIFNNTLIFSLMAFFALPHLTHFALSSYYDKKGFITCEALHHRWLHVVTIVYVRNDEVCRRLVHDEVKDNK